MYKSMHYLYGFLISNEKTCVNYLQERNLLPEPGSCSKLKDCVICGVMLKEYQKNNHQRVLNGNLLKTIYLLCQLKCCQTYQSLKKKSFFFTYYDKNCKSNIGLTLN